MVEYEQEYLQWIIDNGVGNNDRVASSPRSYLSYLNSVSRRINDRISPLNLSSQEDIERIVTSLNGLATKSGIANYKTAMSHYVDMVSKTGLRPTAIFQIRPTKKLLIKDLLAEAKIDVSEWTTSTDPRYCYEWSFMQETPEGIIIVLCLWHEMIEEYDGKLIQKLNLRKIASESINANQKRRALKMDAHIKKSHRESIPIRVILSNGRSWDYNVASRANRREMDPDPWAVMSYNELTGECIVVRRTYSLPYADQFSVVSPQEVHVDKRDITGQAYVRSREVRNRVLLRAEGKCEFCSVPGFKMQNNLIYLETHHVIPLSENGADIELNVVALCPNHHREAHHGIDSNEIRRNLLVLLNKQLS